MKHTKNIRHNLELNCYEFDLTQGQVGFIDLDDYWVLEEYNWYGNYSKDTKTYYVDCSTPYIRLHRLVMNCPINKIIDHKNGITTDNRKDNLLITDKKNNNLRKHLYSNNKTGVKGISIKNVKNKNYIYVRISNNKQRVEKTFDIDIYGYSYALALGYTWRKQKEKEYRYKNFE